MKTLWRQAWVIARKELGAYLSSPIALIFVGVFAGLTLFAFFWVETFFARNIADVRPLFRWMPLLMIFLVAALTMRQWSEEQRGGTLEVLLTLPVRRSHLVLGKFTAVMALIVIALALTLFLPITVDILGDLDWGPVVGGYLAAVLMAASYAAIGLFVSSRTDNQIVALIVTVLICGALYLVGGASVTGLAPTEVGSAELAEVLRAIGAGSRFESIERGVIDLRDLVYYVSLAAFFLALNVISLDSKRWSRGTRTLAYRRNAILSGVLIGANLLALNVWLFPSSGLRADLTAQKTYSLSGTTRELVRNLQEPLLIRGYISERTHPLLAPLVPTIRDLMREYEVVSGGKVKAEIVDPRGDEELEAEANQAYGIRPTPFQIAERYESTVINSYFDILIRYGDQYVTLSYADIIEIEPRGGNEFDVRLRNLEYDLTRSIKKTVYGFQSLDSVFASMDEPVRLTAFVTPNTLPESLREVPARVQSVAQEIAEKSGGKFVFETIDPDAPDNAVTRESLYQSFGLQPFAVSLFSPDSYYLHLILQIADELQLLYPGGDMSEADLRTEIESALKRAAPGFLKTVGLWTPPDDPVPDPFGGMTQPISSWELVQQQLAQDYTVKTVDLSSGRVPGDVDVLVVVAPQGLTDKERFAVDQYLMRGGAVVVAAGNYVLSPQQYGGAPTLQPVEDGLQEMLEGYGVMVGAALVMDPRNEPFPVQVQRSSGGFTVLEWDQVEYPFFLDVRRDSMNGDSPIVANLPAVTLQWASPLEIDAEKNKDREWVTLLTSTDASWLRTSLDAQPNPELYPRLGFPVEGEQKARPLAVSVRGSFESYFRDHPSPFQPGGTQEEGADTGPDVSPPTEEEEESPVLGTIETSPESSRLVVIGSAEFLDDVALNISASTSSERYLLNLQFLQNAVDWSVEDVDLLEIRSRGAYTRLLKPLEKSEQTRWEVTNYVVALLAVVAIGVVWNLRQRSEAPMLLVDRESLSVREESSAETGGEA
jgi:ABC-2 type transport system permease protein